LYISRSFLEKVKGLLEELTEDKYAIVEDRELLQNFELLWDVSVPVDIGAKGFIGGVSENVVRC
jgi:hypothetical protein